MSQVAQQGCSFCGRIHTDVQHLIAGPNVNICGNCVLSTIELACLCELSIANKASSGHLGGKGCCSFCDKKLDEVMNMFAKNGFMICNECLVLCADVLLQRNSSNKYPNEVLEMPTYRR